MATIYMREVPADIHKRAKLQAVMEGISMKALILKALAEYLERKGGK